MEDKVTIAELFSLAVHTDPLLANEKLSMNFGTKHMNGSGDVHYLFSDGSIYSFKDEQSFQSLDSMKDCLVDDLDGMLARCETLDDVLKLKCA